MQVGFYSPTRLGKNRSNLHACMMTSRTLAIISFIIPRDIKDGTLDIRSIWVLHQSFSRLFLSDLEDSRLSCNCHYSKDHQLRHIDIDVSIDHLGTINPQTIACLNALTKSYFSYTKQHGQHHVEHNGLQLPTAWEYWSYADQSLEQHQPTPRIWKQTQRQEIQAITFWLVSLLATRRQGKPAILRLE